MPTTEIVSLLGAAAGLLGVILAFVPQWWARRKVAAEAGTETANEAKVRADATAVQIGTSLELVKKLSEQMQAIIAERDTLKKEIGAVQISNQAQCAEYEQKFTLLESELASTQERFAVMQTRFDECQSKLLLLVRQAGLDTGGRPRAEE